MYVTSDSMLSISIAISIVLEIRYGASMFDVSCSAMPRGKHSNVQACVSNENSIEQTFNPQKEAVRLLSSAHYQEHSSPIFKELNLLKLTTAYPKASMRSISCAREQAIHYLRPSTRS